MTETLTNKIKILREKTGAGFLECKQALLENNTSIDESIDFLRKKGSTYNLKKPSNSNFSSIVFFSIDNTKKNGIILEIAAETDFVTKTNDFLLFVQNLSEKILYKNKFDKNFYMTHDEICTDSSIKNECLIATQKFKENIRIIRAQRLFTEIDFLYGYVHKVNNYGKICSIITIDREYNDFIDSVKDVAMHIVAMNPQYLDLHSIPEKVILNEKDIYRDLTQKKYSDKSESIKNKIIENSMDDFFKNNVLLKQSFVKDTKLNIDTFINNKFKILHFIRFESGELK